MFTILDGRGNGNRAGVTEDKRLLGDVVTEPLSAERSREGKLWGLGTGNLTLPVGFTGPVLWFENNTLEFIFVQKIIFGWNGGTTNHNRTVFSLINYNTSAPTLLTTAIDAQIENISLSGASTPTLLGLRAFKWNGVGAVGMTGSVGGFSQISNRPAVGNSSIPIDGEIILGPSNTMRFDVTPEEAGLFDLSVVFYQADRNRDI